MPTTKSIHINGGCQLGKKNKQQLAFRIQLTASCACFWQTASQMALQKLTIPSANGSGIGFCFWQSPSVCVILPQQGGRLQVLSWFINAITHSSSMFFITTHPHKTLFWEIFYRTVRNHPIQFLMDGLIVFFNPWRRLGIRHDGFETPVNIIGKLREWISVSLGWITRLFFCFVRKQKNYSLLFYFLFFWWRVSDHMPLPNIRIDFSVACWWL